MLNQLLDQVKRAIFNDPHNPYSQDNHPGGLIDEISNLFSHHQSQYGSSQNPRPASQDPYGDPADLGSDGFGNVRPASQDPYGDPADR